MRHRNRNCHAVVVLPPGMAGRIRDPHLRRWLSKGRLRRIRPETEILFTVLQLVDQDPGGGALAALRFWGQTGERPGAWMAAADPVHLEIRLDHLVLRTLSGAQLPAEELAAMVNYLQLKLAQQGLVFSSIGRRIYMQSEQAIASARVSAHYVNGLPPDAFMPEGNDGSAGAAHHRLLSEIQMLLHQYIGNARREQAGQPAVNSVWIWGGGVAPKLAVQPIMPLFAGDPLFKGTWFSRGGSVAPWPGSMDACTEAADGGFVAITPDRQMAEEPQPPDDYLRQLRSLLNDRTLKRVQLLFRDGLHADVRSADRYRIRRRPSGLLLPQ